MGRVSPHAQATNNYTKLSPEGRSGRLKIINRFCEGGGVAEGRISKVRITPTAPVLNPWHSISFKIIYYQIASP